jgi:hypothetical protein
MRLVNLLVTTVLCSTIAAAQEATKAVTASVSTAPRQCLIVEIEHRNFLHHGDPARIYRDSFGLDAKQMRSKYSEGQINKLLKAGVHVVVLNPGEQVESQKVCGQ